MALSDTQQLGWLVPAFMLVYMLAAPVSGRGAIAAQRTRPIALGVFVWSPRDGAVGTGAQLSAAARGACAGRHRRARPMSPSRRRCCGLLPGGGRGASTRAQHGDPGGFGPRHCARRPDRASLRCARSFFVPVRPPQPAAVAVPPVAPRIRGVGAHSTAARHAPMPAVQPATKNAARQPK